MPKTRIAGVLLAAGTSSRMGKNKLFLELGGVSVLRRAARTAIAAGLDPLLVVLGHESERARAELEGLACMPVLNPDYASGMNTSLRAGIQAVPPEASAAMVLLADMPFVTPEMVRQVAARWSGEPLAVSLYGDVVAPPILYSCALFPELLEMTAEDCRKRVVKRHRAEALEIAWLPMALADLDVPEDLDRVRSEFEGS
ncbi:MAG: nucleotidyltransferase family protein [Deltaproteobacteria bacterium]|nr:MAG: nucleotidyltransferase family protein [Deltaproteobacteria bacterium]